MYKILLLLSLLLFSCSGNGYISETKNTKEDVDEYIQIEAGSGFEMMFDPAATKMVKEYNISGSTIINGSYFGVSKNGAHFPAGLWRRGKDELSSAVFDDPNITHIVRVSHEHPSNISIFPNNELLLIRWGSDSDAFQAGPLILSGNIIENFTGSWHADEPHERTLMGKTKSGKLYFFLTTRKVTLREIGSKIALRFVEDPITLLNLDGGPSTAYYDGEKGFRENEKLPILFRILQ